MGERSAAVVGATGLIGGHLLEQLLADDRWSRVVSLGRRAAPASHAKLTHVRADLLHDGEWTRALAVDDVFCCLGTTIAKAGSQGAFRAVDLDAVVGVAKAAVTGGCRRFLVVSSIGAGPGARGFYLQVKGEMEREVTALPFESCLVFRPSLLLGRRAEMRLGERLGAVLAAPIAPLLGRYRPIRAEAVAAAMVFGAASSLRGVHVIESDRIAAIARGRQAQP